MPFADHRFIRSVLGATAVYLLWSAVAPPFEAQGPQLLVRMVLAVSAVIILGVALLRPLRPVVSPTVAPLGSAEPNSARTSRRWQSRMLRQPIIVSPTGVRHRSPGACTDRGEPRSIIVLCDGTPAGDSACRLAERFTKHGAAVYAFAFLPPDTLSGACDTSDTSAIGPIESFLDRVAVQLRRTASAPEMWPLTLVVHDLEGELQRACASFAIDTIIVPAALCAGAASVLGAASAAISAAARSGVGSAPVLCVVGAEGESSTSPTSASRRSDVRTLAPLASGEPIRSPS